MNNPTNMFIKPQNKITKYLSICMILIFFLVKIEYKCHQVFNNLNVSLLRVLDSFGNLETGQVENQKDPELVIEIGESGSVDVLDQHNSTNTSGSLEGSIEDENNSNNENYNFENLVDIPTAQLHTKLNSNSIDQQSKSDIESHKNVQVGLEELETTHSGNKVKLENELAVLIRKEKKLLSKLERVEFIVGIYSKAFLSASSMKNTIKFIKKYEVLKKLYLEIKELIEKKEAELEYYRKYDMLQRIQVDSIEN